MRKGNSRKVFFISAAFVAILTQVVALNTAHATAGTGWICDQTDCYVTWVQSDKTSSADSGSEVYIGIVGDPDCSYLRVSVGYQDQEATSEDIARWEAIALTALTTGLPVQFWNILDGGEWCRINRLRVRKP